MNEASHGGRPDTSSSAGSAPHADQETRYTTFAEFYPFYLREHRNPTCRRLHFFGILGVLFCLAKLLVTLNPAWFLGGLVWGYGLAWIGHFVFAKNRPATFKYPLFSLMGDWRMFSQMLTGTIPF